MPYCGGGSGGGGVWGSITGTLSDQTDLGTALGLKANSSALSAYATLSGAAFTGNVSIAQTWNNGATVFGAPLLVNVTNTASANNSLLFDLQIGGSSKLNFQRASTTAYYLNLGTSVTYGANGIVAQIFSGGAVQLFTDGGSNSASFHTPASNVLALYSGTTNQELQVYGTYTDSTHLERGVWRMGTTGTNMVFGTEKGSGGGAACGLTIQTAGTAAITIGTTQNVTINAGVFTVTDGNIIQSAGNASFSGYLLLPSGLYGAGFAAVSIPSGAIIGDATNIAVGTTTGTKIGTAASQKIALWNATPIVQPTTAIAAATFVANTSSLANDTATYDGYTLGQVVKALRNIGLLA